MGGVVFIRPGLYKSRTCSLYTPDNYGNLVMVPVTLILRFYGLRRKR